METAIVYQDASLEIRPLQLAEATLLFDAVKASFNEISAWQSWCTESYSLQDSENFLRAAQTNWQSGTALECGVIEKTSGQVVGTVAVNQYIPMYRMANLGYWTRTSHTGQGIATLAATVMSQFAFTHMALSRIEIIAMTGNTGSQRVAEKLGAHFEGIARNRLILHGQAGDAKMYSLIPAL